MEILCDGPETLNPAEPGWWTTTTCTYCHKILKLEKADLTLKDEPEFVSEWGGRGDTTTRQGQYKDVIYTCPNCQKMIKLHRATGKWLKLDLPLQPKYQPSLLKAKTWRR